MKSIKVFFMGERLRDVYPHATRWQVFKYRVRQFVRRVTIASMGGLALYGMYFVGLQQAQIQYVRADTITIEKELEAPVLERICKAESGCKHLNSKGEVITHKNNNGTTDIGKYQINFEVWGMEAMKMKINLFDEEDNEKFAKWLYANYGTEPWYSSKHNW